MILRRSCLKPKWIGKIFSASAQMTTLESPMMIRLEIPNSLAILNPCQRAKASAILLVSMPNPQGNLDSIDPSGVKKTLPPLPPQDFLWKRR